MNREIYSYLLRTYGRNPGQWIGFLTVLVSSVLNRIVIVIIIASVVSDVAVHNFDGAKHNTIYFLLVYTVGAITWTIGELISIRSENHQYEHLILSYHDRLINKDMSFYRDNQTGYLATAFRQHLDAALQLIRFFRGEALGTAVSLVAPVVVLLRVNLYIGFITFGVVAVQIVYVVWSSIRARAYRHLSHEIYRKITAEVSDEITNIVAFKAGGLEQLSHRKFAHLAKQETTTFWARRKMTTLLDLPRGILTAVGMTVAIYTILTVVDKSTAALGLIVLTITYMFQLLRSVAALPELVQAYDDQITKLAPTLRYLTNEHETIVDAPIVTSFTAMHGVIEINDVSFSYDVHSAHGQRVTIFQHLNILINSGEQVGIVGLSGAGKSTLANLLMRFDEVEHGSIVIDGLDIRSVSQSELRRNIAYVPQEPLLFHRTVRENIAYYNTAASEDEIIQAAQAAHAHDFIQLMPDKYDTIVGERGIKLSGGQKQRVAIARAVLKKAPIMIFDEATSALDSESEQIIQRALPQILGRQTAVIIAHRLSTIASLDRILVMHAGQVVEEGSHSQLLELRGRYYSLWQRQTAGSV